MDQLEVIPILLSILIPSIPSRAELMKGLLAKLDRQIGDLPIEIIVLVDNRKRPLGAKRNSMMEICKGQYLTHLDDDDDVSGDYISTLLPLVKSATEDVICFRSYTDLGDGMPFIVETGLSLENEQTNFVPIYELDGTTRDYRPGITRKPWHWCVWKTSIAIQKKFPLEFYGEDWKWIDQVLPLCNSELKLDKVLHFYSHRKGVSLS